MASWSEARAVIGDERVLLGPQASAQWLDAPEHLAMVLARYRAASALIGSASRVLEIGCGEGIGARILRRDRLAYVGLDPDAAAVCVAREPDAYDVSGCDFYTGTATSWNEAALFDAVVALDVIEHVEDGAAWLRALVSRVTRDGVCVIGTPNAAFAHLASAASVAGHVTTYTHDVLLALMARHFRLVQSFGMQDTALHLGHPEARHYLLMCGIGLR